MESTSHDGRQRAYSVDKELEYFGGQYKCSESLRVAASQGHLPEHLLAPRYSVWSRHAVRDCILLFRSVLSFRYNEDKRERVQM